MARATVIGAALYRTAGRSCGHSLATSPLNDRSLNLQRGARERTAAIRESENGEHRNHQGCLRVSAIFVDSKTGRDDAPFVFVRVGGEERRMRWSEWDSLPAWTGETRSWTSKSKLR
jgi:hypothetical protein